MDIYNQSSSILIAIIIVILIIVIIIFTSYPRCSHYDSHVFHFRTCWFTSDRKWRPVGQCITGVIPHLPSEMNQEKN